MASDIKAKYGTEQTITCAVASLASDTNLVAGRASTIIDNSSNLYLDYHLSGRITTGTSPTAARIIEVFVYAQIEDAGPTYPDSITGTDANKTLTHGSLKDTCLMRAFTIDTDNTSNRAYDFGPISIRSLFNGIMPKKFGVFVVQSTGQALHATGGNHFFKVLPEYATVG